MKKLVYILLVFALPCYAQNPEWINLTNGDQVSAIVSSGNDLWIGTDGGLVKLNKTTEELTFYNRANANLPDNHMRTLAIDSAGYLWIGTQYSGIGKFDGSTCQVFNTKNSHLPHDQWNVEIEVDPEGNIWIGSLWYLSKYNGTDWKIYETGNPLSAYFSINDIMFDKHGTQWIAASWGLGQIIGGNLLQQYEGLNEELYCLEVDNNNNIWIGTNGKGLIKYDGSTKTFFDTINSPIPSNIIFDMKLDSKGNLWLATPEGLVKYDGTEWIIYNTESSELPENFIYSIEIDEKDVIWIGTRSNGLIKFDGVNWKRYKLSNSILPSNAIYSITFDSKDNAWIGTAGKTLLNFDRTSWVLLDTSNSGLLNTVFASEFDKMGNLWIGGYRGKPWLTKYDGQNWLHCDSTNSPFSSAGVSCLRSDPNDNLWISAGFSHGLIKFDGTNWTIYNMQNTTLTSEIIQDIEFDKYGNLWASLRYLGYFNNDGNPIINEGGLAKYDGNIWYIYNANNSGLPFNNVKPLAIDSEGNIWLSAWDDYAVGIEYGYGLTRFDGTNWTTYNIYNSPLTSNTIFDITVDKEDNLWLSTCAGGLVKYDRKNSWTVYNIRNSGIAFDSQGMVAIDSYGNKWITGENNSGLSIFREGGVILTDVTDNKENSIPTAFFLYQNYPNPFNPTTKIKYTISASLNSSKGGTLVSLKIYDLLGREIMTLVNEGKYPGTYEVEFNINSLKRGLASGTYFYQLRAGEFVSTKKFILMK